MEEIKEAEIQKESSFFDDFESNRKNYGMLKRIQRKSFGSSEVMKQ